MSDAGEAVYVASALCWLGIDPTRRLDGPNSPDTR